MPTPLNISLVELQRELRDQKEEILRVSEQRLGRRLRLVDENGGTSVLTSAKSEEIDGLTEAEFPNMPHHPRWFVIGVNNVPLMELTDEELDTFVPEEGQVVTIDFDVLHLKSITSSPWIERGPVRNKRV